VNVKVAAYPVRNGKNRRQRGFSSRRPGRPVLTRTPIRPEASPGPPGVLQLLILYACVRYEFELGAPAITVLDFVFHVHFINHAMSSLIILLIRMSSINLQLVYFVHGCPTEKPEWKQNPHQQWRS
jgi:hypothetical protein